MISNTFKLKLNSPAVATQILRFRISPLVQRYLLQPHEEEERSTDASSQTSRRVSRR